MLLPYAIVVSVFSAILGYASKEAIENFFGGLLLQIDKPFEVGERLVLEGGEICDVREVGMRSTKLYNVLENTELSIPNRVLANQTITNISRPDLELRVQLPIQVLTDSKGLEKAELILLDIAYLDPEVDTMRISKEDVPDYERARGRRSVEEEIRRIVKTYPDLKQKARLYKVVGRVAERRVFPTVYETLDEIVKWRKCYSKLVKSVQEEHESLGRAVRGDLQGTLFYDELERFDCLRKIKAAFHKLSEQIYAMGDTSKDIRRDLDTLIGELYKEPVVHSEFRISEEGYAYHQIMFNFFTLHLERKFEVSHKVGLEIERRFEQHGIKRLKSRVG